MPINDKQQKYLRGLAHDLKPVVHVGNAGVTPGLTTELEQCLDHHELIKVKLRVGDRGAREAAIGALIDHSNAELVARIGNIAILYRRKDDAPVIALP